MKSQKYFLLKHRSVAVLDPFKQITFLHPCSVLIKKQKNLILSFHGRIKDPLYVSYVPNYRVLAFDNRVNRRLCVFY